MLDANDLEQLSVSWDWMSEIVRIKWKPLGEPVHYRTMQMK